MASTLVEYELDLREMEPLSGEELEQLFIAHCEARSLCWCCGRQDGARSDVFDTLSPRLCLDCWMAQAR